MTQQAKHLEIPRAIERHLNSDNFLAASHTTDNKYQTWYATLLSSLALLAAGDEVVYAYSDREAASSEFRIVVFTTNLVLVSDVDLQQEGVPGINAVRRKSLIGMQLSAAERIDARERRSHEWPGMLDLALTYRDFPGRIEIAESGADRYNVKDSSPIVALIESLSSDLAADHVAN